MKIRKISRRDQIAMIVSFVSLLALLTYSEANSFALDVRTARIDLSTNMVCGTAKRIIEKALKKVDGIIDIDVDPETKTATVTYDDGKLNFNNIEKEITKLGYDANDKTGDPEAYQKLP